MLLPSSPLLCFLHSLCAEDYRSAGQAAGLVSPSPAVQRSLPGAAVPAVLSTNPLPLRLSVSCNPLLLPVSHYLCLRPAPGPLPSCCLKFMLDFSADCLRCGEEKWHKGGGEPPGYLLAPVASNPEMISFIPFCCEMLVVLPPLPLPSPCLPALLALWWPQGRGQAQKAAEQGKERLLVPETACGGSADWERGGGQVPSLPFGSKHSAPSQAMSRTGKSIWSMLSLVE